MTIAADRLDSTFAALADPTRRAIVARLARGDATVNELGCAVRDEPAWDLQAPEGARALRADLAYQECAVPAVSPGAGGAGRAAGWIEENRRIWSERFDKLDEHLRDIQSRSDREKGDERHD